MNEPTVFQALQRANFLPGITHIETVYEQETEPRIFGSGLSIPEVTERVKVVLGVDAETGWESARKLREFFTEMEKHHRVRYVEDLYASTAPGTNYAIILKITGERDLWEQFENE